MAVHTFKAALNQALAHDSQVQKISQRSWCFGLLFAVNHPNCGAIPSICRRINARKASA
jgi:predicted ATPase